MNEATSNKATASQGSLLGQRKPLLRDHWFAHHAPEHDILCAVNLSKPAKMLVIQWSLTCAMVFCMTLNHGKFVFTTSPRFNGSQLGENRVYTVYNIVLRQPAVL